MNPASTLKQKKDKLIEQFNKDKNESCLEIATTHIDEYFFECYATSSVGPSLSLKTPFAIIALGGYGRSEQCFYSDIDVMFLFEKRVPDEAKELVKEYIYPLWDIGFEVGYGIRTINECINLAKEDIEVLTSFLDERFICGMSSIHFNFVEKFQKKISRSKSDVIKELINVNQNRHDKYGDSTYLLEPHLKDGLGSLRDYHSILWIAKIKDGIKSRKDFELNDYLSKDEYEEFERSLNFIFKVRNSLHLLAKRKYDQMYFEYQQELAKSFNFRKKDNQTPVERFLREIHSHMDLIKQYYLLYISDLRRRKKLEFSSDLLKKPKSKQIVVKRRMLSFKSKKIVQKKPSLLLTMFHESSRLKIPLNSDSKRTVKELSPSCKNFGNKQFRADNVKTFENILTNSPSIFNVLNEMLNTGLLNQLIPAYNNIINRIQYNQYHIYPVDKHSLKVVYTIKQFASEASKGNFDALPGDIYKEIKNKKVLLWGALLHDIGKGVSSTAHSEKGAEIAKEFCEKLGMSEENVELITFLIREHLFLVKTATRRDLGDEKVVLKCARKVKNVKKLKMLYLLTVADSISTGPKAWNDWTQRLLEELFFKIYRMFERGELTSKYAAKDFETKKEKILNSDLRIDRGEIEEIFENMSPRYHLYTPFEDIIKHIKLYQQLCDDPFRLQIETLSETTTVVTVCAKESPGLFSKLSGVFAMNRLDILDARVYSWTNQIVMDVFTLRHDPDAKLISWGDLEEGIKKSINEESDFNFDVLNNFSFHSFPEPSNDITVRIDNESSGFFSVLEVFSYDFPGLLYLITDTLHKLSVDIRIAKIATKIDRVVDVFYIRDISGKITDPAHIEQIQETVRKAIKG